MSYISVTDLGPGETMSAAGDASEPLNIQETVPASFSGTRVDDAYNEHSAKSSDESGNILEISCLLLFL